MSDSERDSSTDCESDLESAPDSAPDWANETDLDPADCPFPLCPHCGRPVTRVTSTGPADHTASPCGCRVSGNLLE
ncbi:hypothetical protein [Halostagnicola sp. A-GB9-2]|uniref:hypothetical protein n=1 Tax=Halostagnicola sp. A-GB9-2 TaxID=3048066 RepID=UPI0024BFBA1C|nr:hypothetical protein [Halostagnicola sp. A-GB9-2]MDJ1432155.1 hypothetical protein [Halostagnicola sp. A-GB9-2]